MLARPFMLSAALVLASAAGATAQDVAQEVRRINNGELRLAFASRPGTCGDGETFISRGLNDEGHYDIFRQTRGGWNTTTGSGTPSYRNCQEGPVWVELRIERGAVTALETFVGARVPQPALTVSTRTAADYLLTLAETSSTSVGKHALLPVVLADSVEPWDRMLRLAQNHDAAREVRKSAIFWVGQAAGEKAAAGLTSLLSDQDREIKKQAVFALSQLRGAESVTALIGIVRTNTDPDVRKSALFWLAQKDDPRVIALLEEILLK